MSKRIDRSFEGSLKIKAHAKINLALHIINKRPDSYHNLDSIVVFSDFGDELKFEQSKDFRLVINGDFSSNISADENIIIKAAQLLAEKFQITPHGTIYLNKLLPVGAGIGGGSADAAAALILLNNAWACNATEKQLQEIGIKLGADVPVCLKNTPQKMTGVGEILEDISIPPLNMLLINPLVSVSTAEIFRSGIDKMSGKLQPYSSDILEYLKHTKNDLLPNSVKIAPVIANVLNAIGLTNPVFYSMSGSGSTCFGIYKNEADVYAAKQQICALQPHMWVKKITTFGIQ